MEDKETILQLFEVYANDIYKSTEVSQQIQQELVKHEDLLLKGLSQEQKELLNKIRDLEGERKNEIDKQIFCFAYSLANKLLIESLRG